MPTGLPSAPASRENTGPSAAQEDCSKFSLEITKAQVLCLECLLHYLPSEERTAYENDKVRLTAEIASMKEYIRATQNTSNQPAKKQQPVQTASKCTADENENIDKNVLWEHVGLQ